MPYIYESPDNGRTVFRREFGKDVREQIKPVPGCDTCKYSHYCLEAEGPGSPCVARNLKYERR